MAENKEGQEKSEQPTGKRLEEARKKGQVATSKEFAPIAVLFGGAGMITLWMPTAWRQFQHTSQEWFEMIGTFQATPESIQNFVTMIVEQTFLPILPFALIITAIGVASLLLQTGPLLIENALQPKPSKLNPINGLKKIFSLRGIVELLKSLLKVGLIGTIVYSIVMNNFETVMNLSNMSLGDALSRVWEIALQIIIWVGLVMLVLATADFLYQRWQTSEDLKMTKQETKDESKDVEGDPQIRSRRMSLQRERARQRMMQEVPKADVVITNPTHVAVALRYDSGSMESPTVVAKGAGVIAEKIKQIARHAGVPIIENRSLARGIYKIVKVGQEIPGDLYRAAAEVLAYVYRLKQEHDQAS
ncbi:MAG: flagellar biosynthesis protein FlhB [Nitrospirales bacterium]